MTEEAAAGVVTAAEALEILGRYNATFWHPRGRRAPNGVERARYSIPPDPRRDDDIRLAAFIHRAERIEKELDELRMDEPPDIYGRTLDILENTDARAKDAEAKFAALRDEYAAVCATLLSGDTGCVDDATAMAREATLATLADTAAAAGAYTRRVRAEALRASATTIDTWEASDDRRANGYQEAADHLRAEAERIEKDGGA